MGLNKRLFPSIAAAGIPTDGLIVNLDATDSSSYSGSGSTWYDISGSATTFNGSIHGNVSWSASRFDFPAGDGDAVRLPNDSLKLNTISISVWINPDSITGGIGILENYEYSGGSRGILFRILDGKLSFHGYNGDPAGCAINSTNIVVSSGVWQHVVATVSTGSNIGKLYVGDTEVSSYSSQTTGTIGFFSSGHETTIGAVRHSVTSGDTESELDGKISKLRVYNKVLSQSEITTLYSEGSGN